VNDDIPFLPPNWVVVGKGNGGMSEVFGTAGTEGRLSGRSEKGLGQLGTSNAGLGKVL